MDPEARVLEPPDKRRGEQIYACRSAIPHSLAAHDLGFCDGNCGARPGFVMSPYYGDATGSAAYEKIGLAVEAFTTITIFW